MTIRQNILQQLVTDLAKITADNGYINTLPAGSIFNNLSALDGNRNICACIELGASQYQVNENGREGPLKAYIYVRVKTVTDISKEGLVTNAVENVFADLDRHFTNPTVSGEEGYDKNKMSRLWEVQGVDDYWISIEDPVPDTANENISVAGIELTIDVLNNN